MNEYVFSDAAPIDELERLRLLEAALDDATRSCIDSAGVGAGQSCLEVGAGAGSIASWLGSRVTPDGNVLAVDVNDEFLRHLAPPVGVLRGDVRNAPVPPASFDLAHARYVLIHNADPVGVLDAMLRALKPGGALILEEPDFSAARAITGPSSLKDAFDNVTRAIELTFSARGLDYAFGRQLPSLDGSKPITFESVQYDRHVRKGGSTFARMMRASTLALKDKYLASGGATEHDIRGYVHYAASPNCWGVYYATVRIVATKAAS